MNSLNDRNDMILKLAFLDSDDIVQGISYPSYIIWKSISQESVISVHGNLRESIYNSDVRNTIFEFISNCVGGLNNE